MSDERTFTIHLEQLEDFEFKVRFDWPEVAELRLDEPEPLGRQRGPNAGRLLAAAVGNCLAASLLFCLRRSHVPAAGLRAAVNGTVARNDAGRLRIQGIEVTLEVPAEVEEQSRQLERCLGLFEDFCMVTASVRQGIPVAVRVVGASGQVLSEG